jgi:hypothetical protein
MSEHAPGAAFNANAADTTDAAVVFEVPIAPMVTTQRHVAAIPRKREGKFIVIKNTHMYLIILRLPITIQSCLLCDANWLCPKKETPVLARF